MSTAHVDWTLPEGALWDEFDVYSREHDVGTWLKRASTRATEIDLQFPDTGTWDIAVAPRTMKMLAPSDLWTFLTFDPQNLDDQPALDAPANFVGAQDGSILTLQWDPPSDKRIAYGEIRRVTWEYGQVAAKVGPRETRVVIAALTSAASVFLMRWISDTGKESALATLTIPSVPADNYWPVQGTVDEHGGGYAATKTDVEVNGGNLRQTRQPATANDWTDMADTYDWPPFGAAISGGTYVTSAVDVGSVVDEKLDVAISYSLTKVADTAEGWTAIVAPTEDGSGNAVDPGTRSIYSYINGDGTLHDGATLKIEVDTALDGVPTWVGYRAWIPGMTYNYRQVRLRFTFSVPWFFHHFTITALTWKRRRQNRKDEGTLVISGTGGTDITFVTGFTVAPYLSGNLIHATNVGIITFSNITTTGAKARIYDAAGAETTGTIHWHALGV